MAVSAVDKLKIWLFPTLISILSVVIWQEVSEIKKDVKALLSQSAVDKTRIDNLERLFYGNKKTAKVNLPPSPEPPTPNSKLPNYEYLPGRVLADDDEEDFA